MSLVYVYEEMPADLETNGHALIDWADLPEINRILNGDYTFYGNYSLDGQNVEYLKEDNFIRAEDEDGKMKYFEIKKVTKNLNSFSITGRAIGYMLSRNFIESSFTQNGTGSIIMSRLKAALAFEQPFSFESDIQTVHQFTVKQTNPVDAVIGSNNGNENLASITAGELDMDNYRFRLLSRIGKDNGYRIDLGVNLESIEEEIDGNYYNSLYLIGGVPEGDYDEDKEPITYKYLELTGVTDKNRRIGKYENSELTTVADLKKWGQSKFDVDLVHEPSITHTVSMVQLENTMEYEDLYDDIARLHLASFVDTTNVEITGNDALILDNTTYSPDKLVNIFMFTRVKGITIRGIDYKGKTVLNPSQELNTTGATFAYIEDNCSDIDIDVYGENLRYGIRSGDYLEPSYGYCKNIKARVTGKMIGYPIALSLSENVNLFAQVEGFHRSIYLAGVSGGHVESVCKNQYGAVIHVLLTNAITIYSTVQSEQRARGCVNIEVKATDAGSTVFLPQSSVCGLGLQWVAQGTTFENLTFRFYVKSNNTIASSVGGFLLESSVAGVPFTWEPYISLKNIKVSGTISRESQTEPSNSLGEIYIRAYDQKDSDFTHCPIVNNFTIEDVVIEKSSNQLRSLFFEIPNISDSLKVKNLTAFDIDAIITAPKGKIMLDNVNIKNIGSKTDIASMIVKNSSISDLPFTLIRKLTTENSRVNRIENYVQTRRIIINCDGNLTYTIPGALKRGNLVKSISAHISNYVAIGTLEIGIPGVTDYFGSASLSRTSGLSRFSPPNYKEGVLPRYFNPAKDLLITFKPDDPSVVPVSDLNVYIEEEILTVY
ncbi:phage tail spike protein [Enterococcus casseliflavus]|uniref:phage tail spike protein n=1 Tax=Enterococcus casseliflavus TaxID=37734 RepID=UPI0035CBD82D